YICYTQLENPFRWTLAGISVASPLVFLFLIKGYLKHEIPDLFVRYVVLIFLVSVPILSFASGKKDAELILNNIEYKYSLKEAIITGSRSDTLKLVGFTSSNMVFSTLDNEQIYILDRQVDTLKLKSIKRTLTSTFLNLD